MSKRLLGVGTVLLGLGLLALGAQTLLMPELAAAGFGVPVENPVYLTAAGMRDVALGAMALGLLKWHSPALRVFLPALLFVPLSDVALVLVHGTSVSGTLLHALGAVYIAGLGGLAFRVERA
jgi:hypothetical protein